MIILSEHNLKHLTDEEVLLLILKEYADPSNHEPYEKDYGNGAVVERMPYLHTHPEQRAKDVLAFIAARKEARKHG